MKNIFESLDDENQVEDFLVCADPGDEQEESEPELQD